MQVTLDAIDWKKLTAFGTAEKFLEYLDEAEDEPDWILSCYEQDFWRTDSAMQYFEAGIAVDHLEKIVNEPLKSQIRNGLKLIITENGQIDEFKTGEASEGCYWVSASPETTKKIHNSLNVLDLNSLKELLHKNPPPRALDILKNIETDFIDIIEQHRCLVKTAAERGYGLLGHCG